MSNPTPTPIIIGIGDIINRSLKIEDAIEPLGLMLQAVEKALLDTGVDGLGCGCGCVSGDGNGCGGKERRLREMVDDARVVANWTWGYEDICGRVLEGVRGGVGVGGGDGDGGIKGEGRKMRKQRKEKREKGVYMEESEHRGTSPVKMIDEALISSVTKTGTYPKHWTPPTSDPRRSLVLPKGVESTIHDISLPIQIYPLYENAFRAHRHQTPLENNTESAKLYAQFADVAASNEYAWNREQAKNLNEESIGKVGKGNRMICWPYPLLMNAFNNVNMAASCIITSVEIARELGISEDKWIYPLGGAGMKERENFWERPNFYSSEALEISLDSALAVSGLRTENVDLFDFYSCFPVVPKMAAHHLKIPILDPPKPITLLGGLTSFGGAGNNYSMHAVTEMSRQLRSKRVQASKDKNEGAFNGLILANGGVLTYQHVICLSTQPRSDGKGYQDGNPCPSIVQSIPLLRSMTKPPNEWSSSDDKTLIAAREQRMNWGPIQAAYFPHKSPNACRKRHENLMKRKPSNDKDGSDCIGSEGVGSGIWEGVIETYTTQFSRTNEPEIGFIVGRLKYNGKRFVANVGDGKTLNNMIKNTDEVIGKSGWVWKEENGKRNLFGLERGASL
ncbi:thiolase [Sclerotinia borealis F-4128]|uniref:Thiolase n=1 Tax=Sclerotinia borealis (strain F-4128) TaxID=1432307 RepID=W9C971_SCLBF|nr:thiolase [Sclerotinia borealis F-4128]